VLSPGALSARIRARGVTGELARNHVESISDLLALFVAGPRGLGAWVKGSRLLDDDHPFLEFAAAREIGMDQFEAILRSAREHLDDPALYLDDPSMTATVARARAVRGAVLDAAVLAGDDWSGRAAALESGLAAAPASALLRARYKEVILAWAASPTLERRGPMARAPIYERALAHDPELGEAAVNLAIVYAETGREDDARRIAREATRIERVKDAALRVLDVIDQKRVPPQR
jgi:hypothetical protein